MLRRTGLAVAFVSMLLAGCGADQATETTSGSAGGTQPASELAVTDEPTEATEEALTEEPTEAAEEGSSEEPTETASEAAAARKDKKQTGADGRSKVAIRDFRFHPEKTQVSAGTTIRWTNFDAAAHTVTFDSGPDSGSLDPDATFTATFRKPGTYAYTCEFHPFVMDGTVVVTR